MLKFVNVCTCMRMYISIFFTQKNNTLSIITLTRANIGDMEEKKVVNKDWDKDEIYTVFAKLSDGVLSNEEGEFLAVTYKLLKREYEGVLGFYSLQFEKSLGFWIIFQCVPFDLG